MGIKEVFRRKKINYYHKTIIQSSNLKEKVEKLGVKKKDTKIISNYIVLMYPLITFRMNTFYAKDSKTLTTILQTIV